MLARPHVRRRDDRGAAAVEFALVLIPLCMLLFGIISTGFSYSNTIGATDAVREGARFGATTLRTSVTDWPSAVQTKTKDLSYGAVANTSQVCVKLLKGPAAAPTTLETSSSACSTASGEPATPTNLTATDCVVKVWATLPVSINFAVGQYDLTVVRQSVSRYERTCA